ncbi:NAD(P)/FAD-dependent oxidoreductase [Marinibaculum pumilum]|uniref:NAD(P)/FAD-dependent oxidoreductase n=1 Tax=Marinibaculum pumilum TaxID=1766165 RepID=A0ABV7KZJ6_9PROT
MDEVDAVVVGAGVVGLAAARALALQGREVIVLEAEDAIGTGTSSRNSEVIHAGIYYPTGSLKAASCIAGRRRLYAYCDSRGIPYRRCGKLIVAADDEELPKLEALVVKAEENGLTGPDEALRMIGHNEALALEPELACIAAAVSPSTGIIDSHGLMLSYQGEMEACGGMIAFNTPLLRAEATGGGFEISAGGDDFRLRTRVLVNAAGLHAQEVARRIDGLAAGTIPPGYYAKGCYFSLAGRAPFSRLVYPMPVKAGLGVHLTIDLGGQARFGPDAEYVDSLDYDVDPRRADSFYAAIRRYWPALPDGALQPGYAGIRPKLQAPGEDPKDFLIQGPADHGLPGLVNLYGIESPGLTASLDLADRVTAALD